MGLLSTGDYALLSNDESKIAKKYFFLINKLTQFESSKGLRHNSAFLSV